MLILATLVLAILAGGEVWCRLGVRRRLLGRLGVTEALFLRAGSGFVLTTLLGVILAWVGDFGWKPIAVILFGAYMVTLPLARRPTATFHPRRRDPVAAAVVLALVAVGAAFYFPSFDVRVEARDPGIYYLAGARLADTGSMDWIEPIATEMSMEEREYFFPPFGRRAAFQSNRFVGFYMEDRATARVVPQALPVLPLWMGLGRTVGGARGGLAAPGVVAILAMTAFFFLGRRTFGTGPAAAAALLLGASWVQAWFSRYAAAEIAAQALLATALYGLVLYRRHRDPGFGLLAASGLGLLMFTKAEMAMLLVPLAVVFLADALRDRLPARDWVRFWVPLGVLVVASFVYGRLETWPYHYDLLQQLQLTPRNFVILATGGVATLALAGLFLPRLGRRLGPGFWATVRGTHLAGRLLGGIAALSLLAGAAWGYFIRPAAWEAFFLETGRNQGSWDAYNLVELGWAVSPAAIALAALGYAALLIDRARLRRGVGVLLWLGLSLTIVLVVQRQIHPVIPWAYRRWLPFLIPMLWLFAAVAAARLATWTAAVVGLDRRWRPVVVAAIAALLLLPVLRHQLPRAATWKDIDEMPRVAQILGEIRSATEPGSLLLFEARSLAGLFRFEAALHIDGNRQVLSLPRGGEVNSDYVRNLVLRFARRGTPTYLVTTGYLGDYEGPAAEPVHEFRWPTRRLVENESGARFRAGLTPGLEIEMEELEFRGRIYRLGTAPRIAPLTGGLDVGAWDDLYLDGTQLHFAEMDNQGRTYRWTKARPSFRLPGLDPGTDRIVVVADPDTPAAVGSQTMEAFLDGERLGVVDLVDGWRDYEFRVPDDWSPTDGEAPELSLTIDPWFRLSDVAPGATDRRIVGVKVDRIRWIEDGS